MELPLLVINADDFGKDAQVNRAVVESFQGGLCSSATIMPTGAGFEEACDLAHQHRLRYHVGIHLVLRGNPPLTDRIRRFPRFCDGEGNLRLARFRPWLPILFFERTEQEALAEEIRAQIQRCRKQGLPLTHADSHYHLHNEWAVASVLIPILHEEKILHLRIARNCGRGIGPAKRIYKWMLNRRIREEKLDRTDCFGSVEDYLNLQRQMPPGRGMDSFEVMVHPQWDERGTLIDAETNRPLEGVVQRLGSRRQAVSFVWHRYLQREEVAR